MTLRSSVRSAVNSVLQIGGLEVRSLNTPYTDYRDYIPLNETIDGATRSGLSVAEYIDVQHNVPGATRRTIEQMAEHGVFDGHLSVICEIGPGSGRYLAQTLARCKPTRYEVYETSAEWRDWLTAQYDIVVQPCDGRSLAATPSASVDLVQAHKVLPGQPSLVTCRYFEEMARIVRVGGRVVFDIVTENCFSDDDLTQWYEAGGGYQHYPCLVPRQFTIDFFARRGFVFTGSFLVPMLPGRTDCMTFRLDKS